MLRALVIFIGVFLLLCVACVGLGYAVMLPRFQDALETDLQEAMATYVAPAIAGEGITPQPGTYTLTAEEINRQLGRGDVNLSELSVRIEPDGLWVTFGQTGQTIDYRATPVARDGRLELEGETIDGVPGWLLPISVISTPIESAINTYIAENNLVLSDVRLESGQMTLLVEAA